MKIKLFGRKLTDYQLLLLLVLAILFVGTCFYHFVEHLSWLDAYYFSVVTLATIGYGDITPQTPIGKLFTTFYILIGVGVIGLFINTIVRRAKIRRRKRTKQIS